jgi:hypothetical protein
MATEREREMAAAIALAEEQDELAPEDGPVIRRRPKKVIDEQS